MHGLYNTYGFVSHIFECWDCPSPVPDTWWKRLFSALPQNSSEELLAFYSDTPLKKGVGALMPCPACPTAHFIISEVDTVMPDWPGADLADSQIIVTYDTPIALSVGKAYWFTVEVLEDSVRSLIWRIELRGHTLDTSSTRTRSRVG